MTADEEPFANELVQGSANGQSRDAELGGQLALGGDRLSHAELLDEVEDTVPHLALLGGRLCRVALVTASPTPFEFETS